MNLYLLGVDESLCTWDEDLNPTGIRRVMPDGWHYLDDANRLIDALYPALGEQLRKLTTEAFTLGRRDQVVFLDRSSLRQILDLLERFGQEVVGEYADAHWHARPEKLAWLRQHAAEFLEEASDPDGKPVQSLGNAIANAQIVRNFLDQAWQLGCDVGAE